MVKIIVLENQSLFDLAIQECGSLEMVFQIARLNGLAISEALVPGSTLEIPETFSRVVDTVENSGKGGNQPVAEYYSRNNLKPATDEGAGGSGGSLDDMLDDGIDFMAIQVDNIVM